MTTCRADAPLVSAIVSTYNAERFIRGKLEDLEAQTIARELEIIVIDSGSLQNEGAIVEEFQGRYTNIRYIRTEERETVYQAWNRGIRLAQGEFACNANTDDRLRRDCYETLVRTLRQHPNCVLAYPDMRITRQENATFENHTPYGFRQWPEFTRISLLELCCVGPFPLWRRSLHEEIGYFDERFRSAADYEFWLRAALKHEFIHVPEFLGLYWLNEETVSRKGDLPTLEYLQVQKEYRPLFAPLTPPAATLSPAEEEQYRALISRSGNGPGGIVELQRFAERHPNWPRAQHDLADLYLKKNETGLAKKHFEKAAILDPASSLYAGKLQAFLRIELYQSLKYYTAQAAASPGDMETQLTAAMICLLLERFDLAREHYLHALVIEPGSALARENLAYLDRLTASPGSPPPLGPAFTDLSRILWERGSKDEALTLAERDFVLAPLNMSALDRFHRYATELDAAAHFNLGCSVRALAGPAAALCHFAKAAGLRPEWCEARGNLGLALAQSGRMAEAAVEFEAAAALKPEDAGVRNNLGLALSGLGRGEEACASFKEAIRLDPLYAEAHNNLAILFERYGRTSEAVACCEEALRLRPDYAEAHHNLASALRSQGRHTEAISHLREALRLKPDFTDAHSSLLFTLCYPARLEEEEVAAEHKLFGAAHRFPIPAYENDQSPDRVINIGYVSADFRSHAVSRFIEPVLRHHDRSRFRITCYSNVPVRDARTAVMEGLADSFVNIAGVPDEAASAMIRRDRIDILTDLSGHTADNRLLLFARKPAPVQITWLGYPHTTGLEAIDYRITDSVTDPPGLTEGHYTEKLIRLPGTFSCFAPPEEAPEVGDLPLLSNDFVTFGSFNNPAKIRPETVALWAGVLRSVAGSRMLVKGYSLADVGNRGRLAQLFSSHGIAPERLELQGNTASYRDHLALYNRVDIALDTFPYHGTTTTCEALWMGVPVVTLCGVTHRSRVGASILKSVGLHELVAQDEPGFREAAVALARDIARLERLRKTLRETMSRSRLTDGPGFTRDLESAYRAAWRQWCFDRTSPHRLLAGGDQELGKGAGPVTQNGGNRAASSPPDAVDLAVPPPFQGEARGGDGVSYAATGRAFLESGKLDEALKSFLAELRQNGTDSPALGGIEETLNRQLAADRRQALSHDAERLGAPSLPATEEPVHEETLEETAELLLASGFITPADMICRYLLDRGYRSPSVSRTLGHVASSIGQHAFAAIYFREAIGQGEKSTATSIALLKAEESARLKPAMPERERFLLIKAWGYGFWSDVNHVLGQLLLAEITGRIPIVHWGGNSLFSDDCEADAFGTFFEPVSQFNFQGLTPERVAERVKGCSFFPPKWSAANLATARINQVEGPWSRCSSLHALERGEDVVVSDFHYAINDLVPWIPPGHRLYGMTTDEISLDLCRRYLKVTRAISAKTDRFFNERMAGKDFLAVHVRGGDKGGEDPDLARLNTLCQKEVERYLDRHPQDNLFLMTDDRAILSSYQGRYGDRVITTSAARTGTSEGIHYQPHPSRYRLGEEVIVDVLLALRCQAFIGNGLSNVSCAVAQMKEWPPGHLRLLGARLDRIRQLTLYRS